MEKSKNPENDKPPFFKTWKGMYAFVLANLAAWIIIFYILTKVYNGPS